jgi:hypothetical protein
MGYKDKDLKLLWGSACGICSFEGCNEELIVSGDTIGDIAHIVANSEDWSRGDPKFPREKIDSYENLILLCPNHHRLVDIKESIYTVDVLRNMKAKHEQYMREKSAIGIPWKSNLSDLYYINLPRLAMLAITQGFDIDLNSFSGIENLYSLSFESALILQKFENLLKQLLIKSTDIENLTLSSIDKVGIIVEFRNYFFTKNLPKLNSLEKRSVLSGDLSEDPHIYKDHQGIKLILTIDPRWITTYTSFINFRNRKEYFAGLCRIKTIDTTNKIAICTPYIIGIPKSLLDEF